MTTRVALSPASYKPTDLVNIVSHHHLFSTTLAGCNGPDLV
jgi:hypothetical protein